MNSQATMPSNTRNNPEIDLTKEEKLLVFDLLNGCCLRTKDGPHPHYMREMAGDKYDLTPGDISRNNEGVIVHKESLLSGLEYEILDGCNLEKVDSKWDADGVQLLHKIRAMLPERRQRLIEGIVALWENENRNLFQDIEHLAY